MCFFRGTHVKISLTIFPKALLDIYAYNEKNKVELPLYKATPLCFI